MKNLIWICLLVAAASFATEAAALPPSGGPIAVFDEDFGAGMSPHGSSEFRLSDFDVPGAVTITPDSIVYDVTNGVTPEFIAGFHALFYIPMIDFDPAIAIWEVRLRVLPNHQASGLVLGYHDEDSPTFGTSFEVWPFPFDLSSLTPADSWVVLRQSFADPGQPAQVGTPDSVQNPNLGAVLVSVNPSTPGRFNIELDYVRILAVPEPASWILLAAATMAAGRCKTRKTIERPAQSASASSLSSNSA
jgi:hypothetical protein